ncbi:MAG: DEAD/DEAH box helicase family protein, partial [Halothece sp. Uz-M2-17]|nr:DEAD/DEAH box helicase family protein [Halothece sp. Uz-M2-17]
MSKSNSKQVGYNFGRVFFPGKPQAIPDKILFQPLGNHVGNVKKLVKYWDNNDFPTDSSLERVKVATDIHDVGKPQRFEIKAETDSKGQFKKYIYSFRGHRFLAEHKDAWTQSLARGHHDFSVGDITRDAYELKKDSRYEEILEKDPLAYAKELYILEMCDQIEAELACKTFEDTKQAESRTFMEYNIFHLEGDTYQIDPWIFSADTIELSMKSWVFRLSDQDKAELKQCQQEGKDLGKKLDALVKKWWQDCQGKPEKPVEFSITLKPDKATKSDQFKNCQSCYQELAGFNPNPMQQEIFEKITQDDDIALLLKAPTGSGKLETILLPALAQGYSLILPLPARSLIDDHRQRVEKYLQRFSQLHPNKEVSFVIDTGFRMYRYVYLNGEKKQRTNNPRRHLYKGNIILTTLDKFLYRY